MIDDHSREKDM